MGALAEHGATNFYPVSYTHLDVYKRQFLGISGSKYVFLLLVNVLLLLVGMFCEAGAAMVILAPLLAPVAASLGIDLVHFGIIMMANLAVGMVTPPVGVNLYVVWDSAKVKICLLYTSRCV